MNRKRISTALTGTQSLRVLATMSLVFASYCAKVRPPEFPIGTEDNIFEKTEISGADVTITLSSDLIPMSDRLLAPQAIAEINEFRVADAAVSNPRLKSLFGDLKVSGQAGKSYKVKLMVDSENVTALKVVPEDEKLSLSTVEDQIKVDIDGVTLLPIFQYKVDKQGIVERVKNDLKEETRQLQITETDPEVATHVEISTLVRDRKRVEVPVGNSEQFERVFVRSKIENKIFSDVELKRNFNIEIKNNPGLYLATIVVDDLRLLKIGQMSELTEELREALAKNPAGDLSKDVAKCTPEILATIGDELKEGCVLIYAYNMDLQLMRAEREILERTAKNEVIRGNTVALLPADKPSEASLVFIPREPLVTEQRVTVSLNPRRVLLVDDLRGKEMLMRRTLQDSPNTFAETFAGSAGDLEIVTFEFEETQVRIRKADALVDRNGNSTVDRETLMLIPAQYFRVLNTDEQGRPSAKPRLVAAQPSEKGIVAYVDWSANSIPTVSSPLDFLGLEQCFAGNSERKVSNIDHRLTKDGVLNLTLTSTYAAGNTSFDCAGWGSAGYFDRIQRTFTFNERISFKQHVPIEGGEAKPLLNIPYDAQKVLGFGLFTYKKKIADEFGNTHVDGTEVPLPAVFDIKNGKKITYVLAGLPEGTNAKDKALREAIVKSTQEVIADLNAGFSKALAGTPMARGGDVIELVVPKNAKEMGELGDLDKNHVFFINKSTDSGVIGLGGSHSNPRNGKVESASVYMYGGNMMSMVNSLRKMAKARKEWLANMQPPKPETKPDQPTTQPAEDGTSPNRPELNEETFDESKALAAAMRELGLDRSAKVANLGVKPSHNAKVHRHGEKITRLKPGRTETPDQVLAKMSSRLNPKELAALKTIEIGKQMNILGNRRKMDVLFNRMLNDKGSLASHRAHKPEEFVTPIDRMEAANLCVMTKQDVAGEMASFSDDIEKMSDLELLVAIWKPTLAHEIGHNLGLRHNFVSSYDKANWKHSEGEETPRTYSSVMDYLNDDHVHYDGLGPQDVAALRAAYAGMVELHPGVKQLIKDENGKKTITSGAGVKVEVVGDGLIKIDDIPAAVGLPSWLDFSETSLGALPVKPYAFCSDEDAGMIPNCNRFDEGTTPLEVVENQIRGYRELYSLVNFGNDKLNFTLAGSGGYIGRIFGIMIPVRQYLEETFYQAIFKGADQATVNSYLQATIRGLLFFHEVIRTPDAPTFVSGTDRFENVEVEEPNPENPGETISKTVRVERKWISDLGLGGESTRLAVRGIEFDKVIATIMLTERNLGFPRYNQVSLNLSYPDLEKLVVEHTSQLELPTVGLLTEVLNDRISPQGVTLDGTVGLPLHMKSTATEMMRIYSLMGSIISLDSTGLEASDNMSRAFRVLSNFTAPTDTINVTLPGSSGDLKYFAFSGAEAAASLVNTGHALGQVRTLKPTVQPMMLAWLAKAKEIAAATDPAAAAVLQAELDAMTAAINVQLATLHDAAVVKDMAVLGNLMLQVEGEARQVDELLKVYPPELLMPIIVNMQTTLENLGKQVPSVNLVLATLADESLASPALQTIVPATTGELLESTLFRNVQILSDLFLSAHPEYLR